MRTFVRALLVVTAVSLISAGAAFANDPATGHDTHANKGHDCTAECKNSKEANCAKDCEHKHAAHTSGSHEHHAQTGQTHTGHAAEKKS